jgi:molybdenum cofactor cytidylyltransferase
MSVPPRTAGRPAAPTTQGKRHATKEEGTDRSASRKERGPRPSALVLAAGTSSRFLGTKQLAEIGGKALIERVLDVIPEADLRETVVVLGHEAAAVSRAMRAREGVKVVVNADYRAGMGTSIRAGILALAEDTPGAMLILADQPFVTRPFLRRMLRTFGAGGGKGMIVAAARGGLVTPPVIFSRTYFRELAALQGDQGARSVIAGHVGSLSLVRFRSREMLTDIDTREDLAAARRLLEP